MAIHFNVEQYHIHFIANNIDYINGKRLDLDRRKLSELKDAINILLEKHGVSVIIKNDINGFVMKNQI
jgi:flagellar biosynthesis regulator FlbT